MARSPPLQALHVFQVAARHGGFTAAARELGLTPAAVSGRMRALEADLGVTFFERSGPRLSLTPQGSALASRLAPAFDEIDRAVGEIRRPSPPVIRIAASPTFASRWLASRLPRLAIDGSRIDVQVSSAISAPGAFDIAIRSGAGPWPGLRSVASRPIGATPMAAPALSQGVCDVTDLARLPLLSDPRWPRWLLEAGGRPASCTFIAVDYPTQDMTASAALDGIGVALLSPDLFAGPLSEGALVQLFAHVAWGPEAYHLLVAEGEGRPEVIALADHLGAAFDGGFEGLR